MVAIKPFPALLPRPELAAQICELPYDVFSFAEAQAAAAPNPLNFLHVSRPEIDLAPDLDPYDPRVYAQGRETFLRLIRQGALVPFPKEAFYLYRQIMGSHQQLGLVAAASCADYRQNRIKKHELTRPDKEDDRVRHIQALNAQTGPAFLTYRAVPDLERRCLELTQATPYADFTASDGVRHTSWIVGAAQDIRSIQAHFQQVPALYIADGHHRSAAADRVAQARQGQGLSNGFLAVIFPHNQLQVLPYNRVLRHLNGHTPADLMAKLSQVTCLLDEARPAPSSKHTVSLYLGGRWQTLRFRPELTRPSDPLENLDVSLLQKHVLQPLFGIENPRTSDQIGFVGGIRGTAELERLVHSGQYACAFSLPATGIEDLMAIADRGGLMPPKSTWFEPKLRDGMFCLQL